jgi:hypothetical protein
MIAAERLDLALLVRKIEANLEAARDALRATERVEERVEIGV